MKKINLAERFSRFSEQWSPRIVGELHDFHIKIAKIQGEFVWHSHEQEDELFLVVKGRLRMRFRDREEVLEEGEMIVVQRGTEHCPVAEDECQILMLEPASTVNTGTAGGERTREAEWL